MGKIINFTEHKNIKNGGDEFEKSYTRFCGVWDRHFETTENLNGKESFRRMYVAFRLLESELRFSKLCFGEYFEVEKAKKMLRDLADNL